MLIVIDVKSMYISSVQALLHSLYDHNQSFLDLSVVISDYIHACKTVIITDRYKIVRYGEVENSSMYITDGTGQTTVRCPLSAVRKRVFANIIFFTMAGIDQNFGAIKKCSLM